MTDRSLESVLADHDRNVLDHLDTTVPVPIVEFGRQGDVLVIPNRIKRVFRSAEKALSAKGVAVVSATSGDAIHLLVGEGDVRFERWPTDPELLTIGILSVGPDSVAFLIHPEHGAIGFPPGDYSVTRQREQADGARFVED
jgi:hypothetical protein